MFSIYSHRLHSTPYTQEGNITETDMKYRVSDLHAHRDNCGEAGSQLFPQLGSRLPPEHQGSKRAEHEPGAINPADGGKAVQDALHTKPSHISGGKAVQNSLRTMP